MSSQGRPNHKKVGVTSILLPVFSLLQLLGCSDLPNVPLPDSGLDDIAIHGRIVDFESCASWNRCTPIEGVQARLHHLPSYVSEPSDPPGRFLLPSPAAHEDDILVDPGMTTNYARTLNPWAAPAAMSDVYGVELLAMPIGQYEDGTDTILSALANAGIDIIGVGGTLGEGGYIGQVLRQDDEGLHAVSEARVEITLPSDWPVSVPAPTVRFINAVPRYTPGGIVYPETRRNTGPFGIFVVPTAGVTAVINIRVLTHDTEFQGIVAPVAPGMVSLGLHLP